MSDERDWDAEFAAITADLELSEQNSLTLTSDRTDIRPAQQIRVTPPPVERSRESEVKSELEDDDFVPPAPAPLNWHDPSLVIMLAALIIGPMWIGFLLFLDSDAPLLLWCAAAGTTIFGFVLAIMRQPPSREETDDGARV